MIATRPRCRDQDHITNYQRRPIITDIMKDDLIELGNFHFVGLGFGHKQQTLGLGLRLEAV